MESSDSDSSTEDDDAQPNNGRVRLHKTSLSHVLLVASICGAFSCGMQAKVHGERMIWGSFTNECIDAIVAEFPIEFNFSPADQKCEQESDRMHRRHIDQGEVCAVVSR